VTGRHSEHRGYRQVCARPNSVVPVAGSLRFACASAALVPLQAVAAMFCPNCRAISNMRQVCGVNWSGTNVGLLVCDNCTGYAYAKSPASVQLGADPDQTEILYPIVRQVAPAEYPEAVRDEFTEALRSLNGGNYKAAVVMTRGALQAATRALQAKGSNLYQEIDDLASRSLIPPSVQQWAHEIRDGGNLVAHPEPGKRIDRQDAEELIELATSIFEYVYVIPAEVARRRQRVSSGVTRSP
jgi:HEPN domain-containing protein